MIEDIWIYVDDIRPIPKNWLGARTYDEAIEVINKYWDRVIAISLDHDLSDFRSDGREMTGYDVLMWIVEEIENGRAFNFCVEVHSQNVVRAPIMKEIIRDRIYAKR